MCDTVLPDAVLPAFHRGSCSRSARSANAKVVNTKINHNFSLVGLIRWAIRIATGVTVLNLTQNNSNFNAV